MTLSLVRWHALLLVCALAACSPQSCAERAVEEVIEAETGAEVDIDAEGAIDLPDDFPAAIPIYPGAVPFTFLRIASEGLQVTFRSDAESGAVQTWYMEQLNERGWEVQMNTTTAEGGMLMAEREGDTLMVTVSGSNEEPETTFMLVYSDQE